MELTTMYESLGVSRAVYEYGEMILDGLRPRFEAIDRTAEYNQTKVLAAMQKNKLSAGCFAATTGYGYDDMGREVLEKVYADCFHTEAALVRPQITCGTHALAVALSANLLPGDELLSPNGAPYDTLEEVIGIRPSKCSLMEYGVQYRQVDLLPDGTFDFDGIRAAIGPAISRCCFETGPEVPEAVRALLGSDAEGLCPPEEGVEGKFLVDLKETNRRRLLQLGLAPEHIDVSPDCTMCMQDVYWSHRATKGRRGTMASVIML